MAAKEQKHPLFVTVPMPHCPRVLILFLILVLPVLIGGCDLQPLLLEQPGQKGAITALSSVRIKTIPDRIGQSLYILLLKSFHPFENPSKQRYELGVQLKNTETSMGVGIDATTTRWRVQVSALYTLTDLKSNKVIAQNTLRTGGSYSNIDGAFYSNTISKDAAIQSALRVLSHLLTLEIANALLTAEEPLRHEK